MQHDCRRTVVVIVCSVRLAMREACISDHSVITLLVAPSRIVRIIDCAGECVHRFHAGMLAKFAQPLYFEAEVRVIVFRVTNYLDRLRGNLDTVAV